MRHTNRGSLLKAILLAGITGFSALVGAQEQPVKIGALLALSGPASYLGVAEKRGLEIALEARGQKLAGRPVKLITYDTEGNSTKAVQLLRRLVDTEGVHVVLGPSTSGEAFAVAPLANELKVPNISYGGAEGLVVPVTKFVFKISPTDRIVAHHMLRVLQTRKLDKVALIAPTDAFGQSGVNILRELAPKYGLEIVASESYAPQDTDMSSQLQRIQERRPSAIVTWGASPGPVIVLRNATALGIKTPIYHSYASASPAFLTQAGPAAEGTFVSAMKPIAPEVLPENDKQRGPGLALQEQYKKQYGTTTLESYVGMGTDAIMLLEDALKNVSGPLTRESLRDSLEGAKGCGTIACFQYSPTNHMGYTELDDVMVLLRATGGKWTHSKP